MSTPSNDMRSVLAGESGYKEEPISVDELLAHLEKSNPVGELLTVEDEQEDMQEW